MGNPFQEIGKEIVGGFVLTVTAIIFILILSAFGNATASISPQAASVTNYGIVAIVIIVGGASIAGGIKLVQIIMDAASGIGNSGGYL